MRRTIEEHTYFAALRLRWIDDAGWRQTRAFFDELPWGARQAVGALVRRKMARDLRGQGLGRHAREDVCAKANADIDAIAAQLDSRPFFGGAEPAAIDACVYAFTANLAWAPIENSVKAHATRNAALMAYAGRMRDRVGS